MCSVCALIAYQRPHVRTTFYAAVAQHPHAAHLPLTERERERAREVRFLQREAKKEKYKSKLSSLLTVLHKLTQPRVDSSPLPGTSRPILSRIVYPSRAGTPCDLLDLVYALVSHAREIGF